MEHPHAPRPDGIARSALNPVRTIVLLAASAVVGVGASPAVAQSVLTYHNDTSRTGWNPSETTLNTTNVATAAFNLLFSVPLDGQVDAQPLVANNQTIAGGVHDVVYAATSNDTIYAIDGSTGAILLSQNFGAPVPQSALPGQCNNNAPSIGIEFDAGHFARHQHIIRDHRHL